MQIRRSTQTCILNKIPRRSICMLKSEKPWPRPFCRTPGFPMGEGQLWWWNRPQERKLWSVQFVTGALSFEVMGSGSHVRCCLETAVWPWLGYCPSLGPVPQTANKELGIEHIQELSLILAGVTGICFFHKGSQTNPRENFFFVT